MPLEYGRVNSSNSEGVGFIGIEMNRINIISPKKCDDIGYKCTRGREEAAADTSVLLVVILKLLARPPGTCPLIHVALEFASTIHKTTLFSPIRQ